MTVKNQNHIIFFTHQSQKSQLNIDVYYYSKMWSILHTHTHEPLKS